MISDLSLFLEIYSLKCQLLFVYGVWNISAWIWNIRDHIKISLYGQKSCVKEIKTVDGIIFIYYA